MTENTGFRPLLLSILLALPVGTALAQDSSSFVSLKQWVKSCQDYKNAYSRPARTGLKLGPRPTDRQTPRYWVLKWNGHDIPIPAIAYKRLRINEAGLVLSDNRHGITIRHHHRLYDSIQRLRTTRVYEVFVAPNKQATAAWKHFFGRPMNMAQFLRKSYLHTVNDLQCKAETLRKDLPVLTYLIFKKSISNDGQAYRINDKNDSFVVESRLKDSLVFNAYLVSAANDREITELTVYTARSDDFRDLGLYIDRPDTRAKAATGPEWLVQLQKALDSRQDADWQRLAQLLTKQGFDRQSSLSVTRWRTAGKVLSRYAARISTLSLPYLDAGKWVRLCALIREELRANPNTGVTYTDTGNDGKPLKFWTLRWNRFHVPIPFAKYRSIVISTDKKHDRRMPAITLRTQAGQGQKVIKMYYTNSARMSRTIDGLIKLPQRLLWPFNDPAKDSAAAWHYYFGRPLQGYDRQYAMYQYSTADLSCEPAQHKQELPILYYLLGKQSMRQKVRAYRLAAPLKGYVIEKDYTDTRHTGWDITLRAATAADGFLKIYITTPKTGDKPPALGRHIGRQNKNPLRPEPRWLKLLQRALDSGRKQDWKKLQAELQTPGYDNAAAVSVGRWIRRLEQH